MTLLKEALECPRCIISVMGDHAGEGIAEIFERKILDISLAGKTFWLIKSPKARPEQVHTICSPTAAYAIFVLPASKGGARPTTKSDIAEEYSDDGKIWHRLPKNIGDVTGKLDSGATALVFDKMETTHGGTIDLWNYGDFSFVQRPLKFILGCSTVCVIKKNMTTHQERMKSRYREIIAVARLAEPYGVWVR